MSKRGRTLTTVNGTFAIRDFTPKSAVFEATIRTGDNGGDTVGIWLSLNEVAELVEMLQDFLDD